MPNIFPPIQQSPQRTDMVTPDDQVAVPSVLGSVNAPSTGSVALTGAQNQLQADTPQQYHYGAHGVFSNIGHVLERFGNIAGDVLDPGATSLISGSDLFKARQMYQDHSLIQQAQENKLAEDKEADTVANESANREQKGDLDEAKQDTAATKTAAALAQHGFKLDPTKGIVPLSYEELSPTQQAIHDLKGAQQEQAEAAADLKKAQASNQPTLMAQAQQRLQIAQQKANTANSALGLHAQEFGFNQDKFYNPQPTSPEITKADLGNSVLHQTDTMRSIIKSHPEFFGAGSGRGTQFQSWLGSSAPDAAKYKAANQFLSDHALGMFGSRNGEIEKKLNDLASERFSPEALSSTLDQFDSTAGTFIHAGTRHGKPGTTTPAAGSPGKADYVFQNGKLVKQ